jgi:methionyl-tRNA formyltransferase
MKIIFFGTSNAALPILEGLSRKHEVLAVVTQPDAKVGRERELTESPVSVLAKEMGVKIFKPAATKDNNQFLSELQACGAELFVVAAFGQILPADIINLPKFKALNVHFSLLPEYRGPSPIQAALLNGDKETGTSIFVLDEQVDHGPILSQESIAIDADDNFLTLSQKLAHKSARLLQETIEGYASGNLKPLPQDDNKASLTKIISKQDGFVNWHQSAGQIYNQFRAFYPWPGIWTKWQGKVVKILGCAPLAQAPGADVPGTVLAGGAIVCGDHSVLQTSSLQLEGKQQTAISDFLNGYRDFIASRLGDKN